MDEKSIEAAARAMYRYHNLREASNDAWRLYESEARAAIAAYRDAEIERLTQESAGNLNAANYWKKNYDDLRAKLEAAEQQAELHSAAWRALGHMLGRFPELSKEIIDAARGGERG